MGFLDDVVCMYGGECAAAALGGVVVVQSEAGRVSVGDTNDSDDVGAPTIPPFTDAEGAVEVAEERRS